MPNNEIRIIMFDEYFDATTVSPILLNKVILDYLPDRFTRIFIPDFYETTNKNDIPENCFYCDYNLGILYFNPANEGDSIAASFKAKGQILYPASRIYSQTDNPEVVENLQNIINTGNAIIQNLQHITISSSSPSGGVNGDMWIKYTP